MFLRRAVTPSAAALALVLLAVRATGLPNAQTGKSLAAFYMIELPLDLPAGAYELHAVPYFSVSQDPPKTEEFSPRVFTPIEVLPRP